MRFRIQWLSAIVAASILTLSPAVARAQAAAPTPVPAGVLTMLTIKPGVDRSEMLKVMPAEVRHTLELYLDGKILQWYGRGDGRGVVFILKGVTPEDAKAITDTLPLSKAGYAAFEYVPLSTLTPLRMLLSDANGAKR